MNRASDPTNYLTVSLDSEDDTVRFASKIWRVAQRGDVIALWGSLGVGKTTFARGFIQAATSAQEEVPSPTFTLVQMYDSPVGPINHFDLYRIDHEDEVVELGIEDAFVDGITLIEWPGKMGHWLPHDRLDLEIQSNDSSTSRTAILTGYGSTWQERLSALNL